VGELERGFPFFEGVAKFSLENFDGVVNITAKKNSIKILKPDINYRKPQF
jgi:hypothetical protein